MTLLPMRPRGAQKALVPCRAEKASPVMDELFGSEREIKIPGMSLTVWIDLFQEGHGFPMVLTARWSSQVGATGRVGGCNRGQEN
jgi:hypothetical protein